MSEKSKQARTAKAPPLTDAERHARFVETARAVDADEDPGAFDKAFASVATPPKPKG